MTRILLLRHGESEANRSHRFGGCRTDAELTELGQRQAETAADYLTENYSITRVYASPLKRAQATGRAVADRLGLPMLTEPDLREIDGGDWDGVKVAELLERYPKEHGIWWTDIGMSQCPNGESFAEASVRAKRIICKIAEDNEGQTVLCATHGVFVRAAFCAFCGIPMSEAKDVPWPGNTSTTVIEFEGADYRVVTYGYNGYLGELATTIPNGYTPPYPLKLSFLPKERIWGGDRLVREFGKETDIAPLGETWELTLRADGQSTVLNGSCEGCSLEETLIRMGCIKEPYNGKDNRFPLLIKFIDAHDKLSVQVHPDDEYGTADGDMGKTEMWYVLDAAPGAELVYGLADGVSKAAFAEAVKAGKTDGALRRVAVKRGDVFFIPAGLVHAIGEGILIAEIQQNSDLTYRVYDYGRRDASGNLRELHIAKALDVIRSYTEEEIAAIRYSEAVGDIPEGLLAACPYFRVELQRALPSKPLFLEESNRFVSLLCTEGEGIMTVRGVDFPIKKGDSWFLPAGTPIARICGNAALLISSVK